MPQPSLDRAHGNRKQGGSALGRVAARTGHLQPCGGLEALEPRGAVHFADAAVVVAEQQIHSRYWKLERLRAGKGQPFDLSIQGIGLPIASAADLEGRA